MVQNESEHTYSNVNTLCLFTLFEGFVICFAVDEFREITLEEQEKLSANACLAKSACCTCFILFILQGQVTLYIVAFLCLYLVVGLSVSCIKSLLYIEQVLNICCDLTNSAPEFLDSCAAVYKRVQ